MLWHFVVDSRHGLWMPTRSERHDKMVAKHAHHVWVTTLWNPYLRYYSIYYGIKYMDALALQCSTDVDCRNMQLHVNWWEVHTKFWRSLVVADSSSAHQNHVKQLNFIKRRVIGWCWTNSLGKQIIYVLCSSLCRCHIFVRISDCYQILLACIFIISITALLSTHPCDHRPNSNKKKLAFWEAVGTCQVAGNAANLRGWTLKCSWI